MSVQSIHNSQAAQAEAVSQAQAGQKQASLNHAIPEDKVTISAAAQAKQKASAVGADGDHDGK